MLRVQFIAQIQPRFFPVLFAHLVVQIDLIGLDRHGVALLVLVLAGQIQLQRITVINGGNDPYRDHLAHEVAGFAGLHAADIQLLRVIYRAAVFLFANQLDLADLARAVGGDGEGDIDAFAEVTPAREVALVDLQGEGSVVFAALAEVFKRHGGIGERRADLRRFPLLQLGGVALQHDADRAGLPSGLFRVQDHVISKIIATGGFQRPGHPVLLAVAVAVREIDAQEVVLVERIGPQPHLDGHYGAVVVGAVARRLVYDLQCAVDGRAVLVARRP